MWPGQLAMACFVLVSFGVFCCCFGLVFVLRQGLIVYPQLA